jgi:putative IMPACT (imprinted ancient) family translation regulator
VAQALLKADKIAIIRQRLLRCAVPYPLEGLLRRELELAGATLEQVEHGQDVLFSFHLPDDKADALIVRLNEAGSGRLAWVGDADT